MSHNAEFGWINPRIERVWAFVEESNIHEARTGSEQLIAELQSCIDGHRKDERILQGLAHAYHVAGYAAAMGSRSRDALLAAHYFDEMKAFALTLKDDTLLVIALTYMGDAHHRKGNQTRALKYLQEAYTHTPQPDPAALGNCAQHLGRVYSLKGDSENFIKVMQEAETLARQIDPVNNSLHGQFCLGTVFVDYAHYYGRQGKTKLALDYLERAEDILPHTTLWQMHLTAARGIILVRGGEITNGMNFVVKAIRLGQQHGIERLQDNFYALERFLSQRTVEISKAKVLLSDTLDKHLAF